MNITLMAFGSRGDVQPFLALAVAQRNRGHNVILAAPSDFEAQIKTYSISCIPIPISSQGFLGTDCTHGIARQGITPATLIAICHEIVPGPALHLAQCQYTVNPPH
jgi:hypothetical protein